MAFLRYGQEQFGEAEELFLKAIELSPNDPLARLWYTTLLLRDGRAAEAETQIRRAVELDPGFALAHWGRALYWAGQLNITNIGAELSDFSPEEDLVNYLEAIDAAIATEDNAALALKFKADKANNELRYADAIELFSAYLEEYPNDFEAQQMLIGVIAVTRDAEAARDRLRRMVDFSKDDPLQLNALINNVLFVGLVDDALAIARDVITRYPQHAFLLYQSHRVLLWAGYTEEAAQLAATLEASGFPEENIILVKLRQACAEGDVERAREFVEKIVSSGANEASTVYIANQLMSRPAAAHQWLIDQELVLHELMSFMNYPYFDHTYFPEIVARLERQGIERPFIEGPPYACPAD